MDSGLEIRDGGRQFAAFEVLAAVQEEVEGVGRLDLLGRGAFAAASSAWPF